MRIKQKYIWSLIAIIFVFYFQSQLLKIDEKLDLILSNSETINP